MIRLPRFTLLTGPKGSGKSTLARLLQEQDPNLCLMSFAEPIRLALLSTFHPEEMTLGLDLRDEEVKSRTIPTTGKTYRSWMMEFGDWMKVWSGNPYIFVDIAKRTIESQSQFYPRFLFDDCRFVEEVAGLSGSYGAQNLQLIHIERGDCFGDAISLGVTGKQGTGTIIAGPYTPIPSIVRRVVRNNSAPVDMLASLRSLCGEWNADRTPQPTTGAL